MVENTETSKWYVVHCHSGFEKKVADSILDEAKKVNLEDSISEVSVPTQAVVEVRRGVRVNSEKKFFPGYVLIKMIMNDDTWHLVRDIPKVSNFLGTKDKPIAISEREVSKLLQDITEGVDNPKPKFEYEVGEQIKVSDGPFASFSGIIEEVDSSRQKLKVSVSIFGRPTPLELDYSQGLKANNMAKEILGYIKLQIPAGSANPAPPVGPALGQKGLNIQDFCKQFNDKTKDLEKGAPIPTIITAYKDRSFDFVTKKPPVTFYLKKAAKIKKGCQTPGRAKLGKVTMKQVEEIAKEKLEDLNAYDVDQASKIILGSARSMGMEIV